MSFFWPKRLNPNPNVLTRFGRVLHWIATGLFLLTFLPGLYWLGLSAYQYMTNDAYWYNPYMGTPYLQTTWQSSVSNGTALSAIGIFVYLCGRALRYIFSGE